MEIAFSQSNLDESVSKKITPTAVAKLMPVLKTAAESAIGIGSHVNRYHFDMDVVRFDDLVGGYIDGDSFVPVRFGLKHSVTGRVTLYLIVDQQKIDIKKIKAEVTKATAVQNDRPKTSRSAYIISIASAIPFVNGKDLLRYLPDDMLSKQQKEAKYDAIAETIIYTNEKNDRHYADYIKSGNLSAAKQMVQQAAKMNGYNIRVYHGTEENFTEFKIGDLGYHVGSEA